MRVGAFVELGLDIFLKDKYKEYIGKRIGLITNMTGVNKRLIPTIDLFFEHPDINITALYSPEHGIRGDAKEGEKVESSVDPHTKLPVYSLYGETRKPTEEMLAEIDVLVFDLQDIGSRYYTYIYTMANVMEACADFNKELIVLDRPNPISRIKVEGNLVEEDYQSFVGMFPIPNRHGMTVGELALLFKHEFGYDCDLTVIEMEGWRRDFYFDETNLHWISPSPNTTDLDMMILYPGTCLIEGTNLSEGRGTIRPFEYIGSPFINGYFLAKEFNDLNVPGVLARPTSFIPTYQKFSGEVCSGVQLHVTDRNQLNAFQAGVLLLQVIAKMYPEDFECVQHSSGRFFFDLLAGTSTLRKSILDGKASKFLQDSKEDTKRFLKIGRASCRERGK